MHKHAVLSSGLYLFIRGLFQRGAPSLQAKGPHLGWGPLLDDVQLAHGPSRWGLLLVHHLDGGLCVVLPGSCRSWHACLQPLDLLLQLLQPSQNLLHGLALCLYCLGPVGVDLQCKDFVLLNVECC